MSTVDNPRTAPTSAWATASLVCALLGPLTCGIGSVLAVPFGHIAQSDIKTKGLAGGGMAVAGTTRCAAPTDLFEVQVSHESTAQAHRLVGLKARPVVPRSSRRDPREDARTTQEGKIMNEQEIKSAKFNGAMIAAWSGLVGRLAGVGKVVHYEMDPTVIIEKPDGSRFTTLLSRCEPATTNQIIEAQGEALKKLRTGA